MTLFHLTDSKEKISLLRAQDFAMSDFTYLSAANQDKQKSSMTWQNPEHAAEKSFLYYLSDERGSHRQVRWFVSLSRVIGT